MIEELLLLGITLPLVSTLGVAARVVSTERAVARVAQTTAAVSALTSLAAVAFWVVHGGRPLTTPPRVLFEREEYRFIFQLTLDGASIVFLLLVQFTTGMALRFSRFYLHREPGFGRFFATVLMFQAAMCVLTLAGNLDLMFAGWEMVGFASFLLIAFYRERHSAVRNALKTYSVYRVADMGMLLAACLADKGSHRELGLLLLLAAMGKSAQFPFSFWVPRAMEGPTPSSALFYGALSVHAGAYLLLRTFGLWGDVTSVRICIGAVGLLTAALCSMFSRVQPTIKGQVGYASVNQVGLIFVELALGLRGLALAHMVCNALLRCYQLLVSPSAAAYLLRRHASAGSAQASQWRSAYSRFWPESLRPSLYVFAVSEGYLKETLKLMLWSPLRSLGRVVLPWRTTLIVLGPIAASAAVIFAPRTTERGDIALGWVFVALSLLSSGSALGSWRRPLRAMGWVSASSLAVACSVFALSPAHNLFAGMWYAAAIAFLCALGVAGTAMVAPRGKTIPRYAGLSDVHPLASALSLVSALGIAGFPLLPTFLGEDLLLHDTLREGGVASAVVAGVIALNGYIAVRGYAFTFLGQYREGSALGPDLASGALSEPPPSIEGWSRSRAA
jgi:NADH:ubiquinone oxidoreductase subunit 5 (subunit L)/multisubunit Na+/H+ antiporter MnhA subunit